MTNKELQQNALAISEIIAQSGVSVEEFQKADFEISKAMVENKIGLIRSSYVVRVLDRSNTRRNLKRLKPKNVHWEFKHLVNRV